MRMQMRRFTRLTNGFSKKLENHEAAIALHYMHYNFCRIQNPTEQALPPASVTALLQGSTCQKRFDLVAEPGIRLTAALLPKFYGRLSHS